MRLQGVASKAVSFNGLEEEDREKEASQNEHSIAGQIAEGHLREHDEAERYEFVTCVGQILAEGNVFQAGYSYAGEFKENLDNSRLKEPQGHALCVYVTKGIWGEPISFIVMEVSYSEVLPR